MFYVLQTQHGNRYWIELDLKRLIGLLFTCCTRRRRDKLKLDADGGHCLLSTYTENLFQARHENPLSLWDDRTVKIDIGTVSKRNYIMFWYMNTNILRKRVMGDCHA